MSDASVGRGTDRGPDPGVFLVTSAGGQGLTRAQVRDHRFVAPSRGVRFAADAPDLIEALTAAAVITAPRASVLCDVAAARHWGLPLPPWLGIAPQDRPIAVAVARGSSRQRRNGVRGRRLELPVEHVITDRGMTVTTPERTWVDCGELLPVEHLVAMGDVILRHGLSTAPGLDRVIRWARGRRGVRAAKTALPLLDAGSESPGESLTRCTLVRGGVPRPECNIDIVADGQWLARVDLAWRAKRVIAEYDGIVHLPEAQRRRDAQRRNLLQEAGWTVIVFTAADLKHPEAMASLVTSALRRR